MAVSKRLFDFEPYDGGAFNYSQKVKVECSQKGFSDVWIHPQNGTTNQAGPFIFDIDPSVDKYLQPNKTMLEMDLQIVRSDGTSLKYNDPVAPICLLGLCAWESVELFLNGQPFSGASSMNSGYKSFLETMLTYDADSRSSHLQSQFFYIDSPGEFDNFLVHADVVKQTLFKAFEEGKEHIAMLKKFAPGVTYNNQILMAEENQLRTQAGKQPVPATWKAPTLSESEKTDGRFKVYEAEWTKMLKGATGNTVAQKGQPINRGFAARAKVVMGSERFDTYAPVCHDFFRVNNNIGPGNRLQLKLTRHKDEFVLNSYMTDMGYKVVIHDMKLHLHYITRRERIRPPLREVYLMNETQLHKQLVGQFSPSTTFRLHNGGVMPKSIVLAMVSVQQAEGAYNLNPWHFHHFHLKNVSLNINGEQYPQGGLCADFERMNPKIARIYRWGFDNSGAADAEKGNLISWNAFMSGSTVIVFDLNPDLCNGLHFHQAEYGYIDVNIQFSQPLNEPIYVLYHKATPKVVINDKLTNHLTVLDIEA